MRIDIGAELSVHGDTWNEVHDGYFSDLEVARSLLERIFGALLPINPDVLIDLGGGTGFLLSEIRKRRPSSELRLVNVDCSKEQLMATCQADIQCICSSITELRRSDFARKDEQALFIMRSVLHYAGKDGLMGLLLKIRSLMRPGEQLIHQTAAFADSASADCMNLLYEMMGTAKWYPTADLLSGCLQDMGWSIERASDGPTLTLSSSDLAGRYFLSRDEILNICDVISRQFSGIDGVFRPDGDGFVAHLPYRIFTCIACHCPI